MPVSLNANALVTLALAKAELDIPTLTTSEDDRVTGFINTASQNIESICTRKFIQTTYTHFFDGSGTSYLKAYEFPIISVTSANLDDTRAFAGGTAIDPTTVINLRDVIFARADGGFWHAYRPMNIKVVYVAGFDTAAIPSDLQQACLELVKVLYYTRNDRRTGLATKTKLGENVSFVTDKLPPMVEQLIHPHRRQVYVANQLEGIVVGGT